MNRLFGKRVTPWLLGLVGAGLLVGASSRAFDWPIAKKTAATTTVPVVVNETPLEREGKLSTSFSAVVKKAAPSVVNISTSKTVKQNPMRPFQDDPILRRFFGDQFGPQQRGGRSLREHSLGSGVIVSKDGYILTNNHVVDGADEITVTLAKDKRDYPAKVIGRDSRTDIALLKIDAKNLPSATLADSDKVEVGDVVLAIGSPFNLSQTVTMGIVSAVGRGNMGIEEYEDFIQTDAAINPGNSGGPLVDGEGRVIGINTAIFSRSGGSQGVGFAIPVNLARNIMDRLTQFGKVARGFLGVGIQDVTPALAQEFNIPEEGKGALVTEVTENSAAAEVGIKPGDVIVEFNGKPVNDSRALKLMAGQANPGAKAQVKILRQGKEKSFDLTLKEAPDQKVAGDQNDSNATSGDALDGVTVSDLDAGVRRQLGIPARVQGALVSEIDESTPAFGAGLRQGDVIMEINHRPVRNAEDAVDATKNLKGKRILLRVFTQGFSRFIVVDESKSK